MVKRRISVLALLLCVCLGCLPMGVGAASTAEATQPIATDKACTLTIAYGYDALAFSDVTVPLYKVADVSADYRYTLTAPFAHTGLVLNGIRATSEWNTVRSTLEATILADGVAATVTAVTDAAGRVRFEGLTPGLYLALGRSVMREAWTYTFDAALVALPGLGEDGLWQHEVAVTAKAQAIPPAAEKVEYKVLKLWKGDEGNAHRPTGIEVDIFRNGKLDQTVTLSEKNHWSHQWSAEADGAKWTVLERNVPDGYEMTVEERGTTFVVTNTWERTEPEPKPPQTGDTVNVWLYVVILNVSGILLIILGIVGKSKRV